MILVNRWGFSALEYDCVYFQGSAGANALYFVLHIVSSRLDLSMLASFMERHTYTL